MVVMVVVVVLVLLLLVVVVVFVQHELFRADRLTREEKHPIQTTHFVGQS